MIQGKKSLKFKSDFTYAIKQIIIPEMTNFQNENQEFEAMTELSQINREYHTLSKLDHPLIAQLLETYIDKNFIYFVNPLYKGGELNDQLYFNSRLTQSL